MIIDAAVVGLPVDRGIGDDHTAIGRSRQSGAVRIRDQQHGSQCGLAEKTTALIDAQQ